MRIVRTFKASAFTRLLELARKHLREKREKNKVRRRSLLLKMPANNAEQKNDRNFIILTEKIENLQTTVDKQNAKIEHLESKILDRLNALLDKNFDKDKILDESKYTMYKYESSQSKESDYYSRDEEEDKTNRDDDITIRPGNDQTLSNVISRNKTKELNPKDSWFEEKKTPDGFNNYEIHQKGITQETFITNNLGNEVLILDSLEEQILQEYESEIQKSENASILNRKPKPETDNSKAESSNSASISQNENSKLQINENDGSNKSPSNSSYAFEIV